MIYGNHCMLNKVVAVPSDSPAKPVVPTILINADDPRFGKVTPEEIVRLKTLYLADQLVLMEALAHDIQGKEGFAEVFKPQNLKAVLTNIQSARKNLAPFTVGRLRPTPTFVGSGEYTKSEQTSGQSGSQ